METDPQNIFTANSVLETGFIHGKALFMYCFNKLASANYIGNIDGEKAFNAIKKKFAQQVSNIYSYRYHDVKTRKCDFNETYLVMKNCVLEFDATNCEIYHDGLQDVL